MDSTATIHPVIAYYTSQFLTDARKKGMQPAGIESGENTVVVAKTGSVKNIGSYVIANKKVSITAAKTIEFGPSEGGEIGSLIAGSVVHLKGETIDLSGTESAPTKIIAFKSVTLSSTVLKIQHVIFYLLVGATLNISAGDTSGVKSYTVKHVALDKDDAGKILLSEMPLITLQKPEKSSKPAS